ncbi:MAG: sodium:alanine symporter family protein, partial [Legionellales bacterium]
AASAKTAIPAKQGMYAISGVFIATIVVCSITGLSLAVTNVLGQQGADGNALTGSAMALAAFGSVMPWLRYVVIVGLILFALTTMLAWSYYGEKCAEYLIGPEIISSYRWIFILMIVIGASLKLPMVWALADITNALMIVPNLISIIGLSAVVVQETNNYVNTLDKGKIRG